MVQGTMVVDLSGELAGHGLGNLFDGTSGAGETVSGDVYGTVGACASREKRIERIERDHAEMSILTHTFILSASRSPSPITRPKV